MTAVSFLSLEHTFPIDISEVVSTYQNYFSESELNEKLNLFEPFYDLIGDQTRAKFQPL
jgi:hypothetical protein